jgi:hypothetical protein
MMVMLGFGTLRDVSVKPSGLFLLTWRFFDIVLADQICHYRLDLIRCRETSRAIMLPMAKMHGVCRTCGGKLEFVGICFRCASQLCELGAMDLVGILLDIWIKCHLIGSHSNTGALSEVYAVGESKPSFSGSRD